MAKIQNKDEYEVKPVLHPRDYVVGTDFLTGKTINIEVQNTGFGNGVNAIGGDDNVFDGFRNSDGTYTWLKYSATSDGANMTDIPTSETLYIGLAYNKESKAESNNPLEYNWDLIGSQIFYVDENGNTHYTWLKYAESIIPPFGIVDTAVGMKYIGLGLDKDIPEPAHLSMTDQEWFEALEWHETLEGLPIPGSNLYNWVKFAEDAAGTNISDFIGDRTYIGFAYDKDTATSSLTPSDYTFGLIEGIHLDPEGTYTWVKFAVTPSVSIQDNHIRTNYLGLKFKNVSFTESTDYQDYNWQLIPLNPLGDGILITDKLWTWIKYAPNGTPSDGQIVDTPAGMTHIGIGLNKKLAESIDPNSLKADQYFWTLIQGDNSYIGEDGKTYYIWTKYANSADGVTDFSNDPTGTSYIGLSYGNLLKESEDTVNSNDPTNYEWSLIVSDIERLEQTYLWVKFSTSGLKEDGTVDNFSDNANGRSWMGISYDKKSPIESDNAADYLWNPLTGDQGFIGADGKTYFTWVKFAKSPTALILDDAPEGNIWMGLAFNQITTESGNIALSNLASTYTWTPIDDPEDDTDFSIIDQDNKVRIINIPPNQLNGAITKQSVAFYLIQNGILVSEDENIMFTFDNEGEEEPPVIDNSLDNTISLVLTFNTLAETSVNLDWANADPNITNYTLFYQNLITLESFSIDFLNVTSHSLSGLTSGVPYKAFVEGYDTPGNTKTSNLINFTTPETYVASTPVLNFIDKTDTTVTLAWSIEASFNADNFKLYEIGSGIPIVDDFVLTDVVTGLTANTAYEFYVIAFSGGVPSNQSNHVNVTTNVAVSPPLTTPILQIGKATPLALAFTASLPVANLDELNRITHWKLQYKVKNASDWINVSYIHDGDKMFLLNLQPDTVYTLRIASHDSVNNVTSSYSAEVDGFTLAVSLGAIIDVTTGIAPTAEGHVLIYDAEPNSVVKVNVSITITTEELPAQGGNITFDGLGNIVVVQNTVKSINLNIDANGRSLLSESHFDIATGFSGIGDVKYTITGQIVSAAGGVRNRVDSAIYKIISAPI